MVLLGTSVTCLLPLPRLSFRCGPVEETKSHTIFPETQLLNMIYSHLNGLLVRPCVQVIIVSMQALKKSPCIYY